MYEMFHKATLGWKTEGEVMATEVENETRKSNRKVITKELYQ